MLPIKAQKGSEGAPTATEASHALALQLLNRYGVLMREHVAAENLPGGFSAVYDVLKALEESGRIRRGYFVAGLGRYAIRAAGRRRFASPVAHCAARRRSRNLCSWPRQIRPTHMVQCCAGPSFLWWKKIQKLRLGCSRARRMRK